MNRRMPYGFYLIIFGSSIVLGMQRELENQLIKAVKNNKEDTVRSLLQQGADANVLYEHIFNRKLPLLYAAQTPEIAQLLLDHKALLIDKIDNDNTLLGHVITFHNKAALIPLYAKHGADPDVIDKYGTAIQSLNDGVSSGNQQRLLMAAELIKAGTSLNILATEGWAKGLTCIQKWYVALYNAKNDEEKKYYQELLEIIKKNGLERKKYILNALDLLIPTRDLQTLIFSYYEEEKFDLSKEEIASCKDLASKNSQQETSHHSMGNGFGTFWL